VVVVVVVTVVCVLQQLFKSVRAHAQPPISSASVACEFTGR
jgi:hypothetical protein